MTETTETHKSLRVSVGILATGVAVALLYYGRAFFVTIIVASMIAFLLDPVVLFIMRMRLPRGLASFLVCSVGVAMLYLAGLGLYTQGLQIADDLPAYGQRVNQIVDAVATRMDRIENSVYQSVIPKRFRDTAATDVPDPAAAKAKRKKPGAPPDPPAQPTVQEVHIQQEPTPLIRYLYEYLRDFYSTLLMASFVPFLVYFLLSWRDHIRSRYLLLFEGEARRAAENAWVGIGAMVRAYVIGNFILGILLTISSGLLFAAINVPYWLLVAPMSGFLSLVPYIGLPLAIAPPLIAVLPVAKDPGTYLYLLISVGMLHLLALNLMYPKLVGARVHLNPLIVTIALMFWGMMWGGIGLLLAIPLTAAMKAVCDHVENLRPYGRLLGD